MAAKGPSQNTCDDRKKRNCLVFLQTPPQTEEITIHHMNFEMAPEDL
jgi:hypothetical protein